MPKKKLPQVGDVIRSNRFIYGEKSFDKSDKRIVVGRDEPKYIVSEHLTDGEIAKIVLRTKKMPKGEALWVDRDYGFPDLTRAKAEYVVIEASMQGGGPDSYGGVSYPDGWHVVAKRLKEGRVWDPKGEEIEFYMSPGFQNMIPPERVRIVGHMEASYA